MGQLLEEIEVSQREAQASTARLDDYRARVQSKGPTPSIDVRSTRFSYVARPKGAPGPPLVAYRTVWVPSTEAKRRDAPSDRWLIQGYALDPGRQLPVTWSAASPDVLFCRGDCTDASSVSPPSPPW